MTTGKLTTKTVDAIKPGRRDKFLWDTDLSGFGVRVTCGGAKSYIYQFRMAGRGSITQRYTIGRHRSPWTARTARDKAVRLAKQVDKGKNPVAKRRRQRRKEVELRFATYVGTFTERYLKHRWKDWKRIENMLIQHAVPTLGPKKISDITRADLSAVYMRLSNTPSVARAMHATLRKMFKFAMSRDDLERSPVDGVEAPPQPRPRTRFLSDLELAAAWQATQSVPRPYDSLFRLLILTGQRRGEVVGLQWSELDQERAEWTLPENRSKNGYSHIIPLCPEAIAELDRVAGGQKWPVEGLILRSKEGTRLSGFSKVKQTWDLKIDAALRKHSELAGEGFRVIEHWRLHDLRRTTATGMQRLGVRTEVIEAVLNHMSGVRAGIVSVYQRHDFQKEKRRALILWGRYVRALKL